MKLRDFILKQSDDELKIYAKDAGTTIGYIKTHILYGYKEPRKQLRKALSDASNGQVSEIEVLQHFGLYPSLIAKNLNGNNSTHQ